MTPEQIERIRKAAGELQAAMNEAGCDISVHHRSFPILQIGARGEAVINHEIRVTATSELKVFP